MGDRLGPLLVQLPPSLPYDARRAGTFFKVLRARFAGPVVCEARHASWFDDEADVALQSFKIARVAADPAVVPAAGRPGGWRGLVYRRLHGAPRMYYSAYSPAALKAMAQDIKRKKPTADYWCMFDNTASGAAAENALDLARLMARQLPGTLPGGPR